MLTITRRFEFDAAHRVWGHESRCRFLHGHRYVAELTINAPELDPLGRIIDFGKVKEIVGTWIDENWDHNLLINTNDSMYALWMKDPSTFGGRKPYLFFGNNPTAENIAKELYLTAQQLLGESFTVTNVRIWETPNCYADYSPR